jgi:hypothetical protein
MKERHIFKNESFLSIHNKYKKFKSENIEVEKIYEIIKNEYMQKIRNNEFNFILERIYLKIKIGWNLDEDIKAILNTFLGISTGVVGILFQQEMKTSQNMVFSIIGLFASLVVGVFIFMLINGKTFRREKNEKIYYRVCLEVLDEIEKEQE